MTRISSLPKDDPIRISPMKAFPIIKDLVNDVSWNYEQNKKIKPFSPRKQSRNQSVSVASYQEKWKMYQEEVDRVQEFRKCIECFLCQNVCHVLRTHKKHNSFMGPRFFVRAASLDMHPLDKEERVLEIQKEGGLGKCNITKCCTAVCPENIQITDNAIIPMKERVADKLYDPLQWIWRKLFKKNSGRR
jgi:succinate dehydrogenase / fumarate reductase iron-sulfur subunit